MSIIFIYKFLSFLKVVNPVSPARMSCYLIHSWQNTNKKARPTIGRAAWFIL
nr:MAG TPA: hypothetical protein [Caudoviricetes sp.]DAO97714.1 MAG TPA: hypothetical protein [Caudoviricetes sp.]